MQRRISNIEQGISNVEGMNSIYLIKKTEQSDSTLRHSIFDILRFAFKCSFTRTRPLAKRTFSLINEKKLTEGKREAVATLSPLSQ